MVHAFSPGHRFLCYVSWKSATPELREDKPRWALGNPARANSLQKHTSLRWEAYQDNLQEHKLGHKPLWLKDPWWASRNRVGGLDVTWGYWHNLLRVTVGSPPKENQVANKSKAENAKGKRISFSSISLFFNILLFNEMSIIQERWFWKEIILSLQGRHCHWQPCSEITGH